MTSTDNTIRHTSAESTPTEITLTPAKGTAPMMNLDDSQKAFVNHPASNIRLLAPAGSGKTTTLLYRCKRLLESRPDDKVLFFTFTRVACEELKSRLTGPDFRNIRDKVAVSTLNAYGNHLLKRKYPAGYRLIDKQGRKFILTNDLRPFAKHSPVIAEKIDDKKWLNKFANAVIDLMDDMKSCGFDHRKVSKETEFRAHCAYLEGIGLGGIMNSLFERMAEAGLIDLKSCSSVHECDRDKVLRQAFRNFVKFYAQATSWLEQQNKFTIEDQKYWGWKITQDSTKVSGAARYAHVMVDEFQDINPIDLFFLDAIRARNNASMTVVGDDDQLIFEWRGATPAYILRPGDYLTDGGTPLPFETCILKRNYRSPRNIVECSQRLISQNIERVKKEIEPVSEQTAQITVETVQSYDDVVELVERDLQDESIRNVAVISRKRSHLIPYQIILAGRGRKFYAAEDLNVMLTGAFKTLKDLFDIKRRQWAFGRQSSWTVTKDVMTLFNAMLRYELNNRNRDALMEFIQHGCPESLIDGIERLAERRTGMPQGVDPQDYRSRLMDFACAETVADTIKCIAENCDGLKKDFRKADDDIFYADPPFQELADFSERYGDDFAGFCEDVERTIASLSKLVSDDEEGDLAEVLDGLNAKLHLMTALRTKGKEFDSVYILNANRNVWPIKQAVEEGRTEAERRLFYVAITRARKKLTFITRNPEDITPYLSEMEVGL